LVLGIKIEKVEKVERDEEPGMRDISILYS
jgi:hypothetical protein